jgi:sugar/nucleoside kinase (ribokinase family)
MTNSPELREQCAQQLLSAADRVGNLTAFVGLDGFVDEIVHVVDKRENIESFARVKTIASLGERISAAAGKSTNLEIVNQRTKLGGNGPIMANALSSFGIKVTYLGALGFPALHPVFKDFAQRAEVHSMAEPGHTDALEFEDGKIMFCKTTQLNEVNWANIQSRYGHDRFIGNFNTSKLIGFVNWTMIPYMSDLWDSLLREVCPDLTGPRRKMFFDLADPEKRSRKDISRALDLIRRFEQYFDVILGLNEKEAYEIGEVLGVQSPKDGPEGLSKLAIQINDKLQLNTLVVHPVAFALAVSQQKADVAPGPFCAKPLISTGAGDHFNSGFCLGKMLGLNNAHSLLTGVATSGFYVRTAHSPSILELAGLLRNWPKA